MTDIVIIGAGPTGLTLAAQLLRHGVACRVFDANPAPSTRSRALGMSARSLEVLDEFGAADDLIELGVRCGVANFYSRGRRIGQVTASSAKHTRFPFMLALPQTDTEAVLERHVRRLGGTVERGVRLTGLAQDAGAVHLELTGPAGTRSTRAGWVIGADGARSAVRTLGGIGYSPRDTKTAFVNVDAYTDDGPPMGAGHYYFSAGAMTVLVGIAGGWYRITTMVDPDTAGELTADELAAVVSDRMGRRLRIRELRDSGWGTGRVRIQVGVADALRAGRCLIAGDAAHVYGPVGAQGMNGGIQDAHNLAWKLALVSTGRAGEGLLDTYQAERLPVAHATLEHAVLQARLGTVRSGGITVRDTLVSTLTRIGVLDRKLGPTVTQLDTAYRRTSGDRCRGTGARIPDTALGNAGGETLFDVLRQRPFTVLVLDAGKTADGQVAALAETLRVRFGDLVAVRRVWRPASAAVDDRLVDRDERLHRHLAVTGPRVCLVRPDGHIWHQGRLAEPTVLADQLDTLLGGREAIVATKG